MKTALILHGAGNNSQGNWFPWLKKELEEKGFKVFSPNLPNADHPKTEEWLTAVKNSGFEAGENSIIVGHSSGGTLILRLLEDLPSGKTINTAVLVAAPLDKGAVKEYWPLKEYITKGAFKWEKIKSASDKFVLIYSDNDPYDCGERHGREINKHLGGELVIKKGQGHFNLEVSKDYQQFPEILKYI